MGEFVEGSKRACVYVCVFSGLKTREGTDLMATLKSLN